MRKPLEHLASGMQLEKPVRNAGGVLLLQAGERLTAKHLEIFAAWGIREAEIVPEAGAEAAPGGAPEAPLSEAEAARIAAEAAKRFRRTNLQEPVMAELHRLVKKRLVRPSAPAAGAGL